MTESERQNQYCSAYPGLMHDIIVEVFVIPSIVAYFKCVQTTEAVV